MVGWVSAEGARAIMGKLESFCSGLMRRANRGDAVAYRQLLQELAFLLRRSAGWHRSKCTPEDIEDAVQETLLALHHVGRVPTAAALDSSNTAEQGYGRAAASRRPGAPVIGRYRRDAGRCADRSREPRRHGGGACEPKRTPTRCRGVDLHRGRERATSGCAPRHDGSRCTRVPPPCAESNGTHISYRGSNRG